MVMVLSRIVIPGRAAEMPPFIVMEVLEKAQQMESEGKSIIHMEVGEPDFDTPAPIREAAVRAISSGDTHYTSSLGKIELREAISAYYKSKYNVEVSPDRILITAGTSPGMLLVFSALMERGDEIILPDPYYACYPNFIRYLDGQPVFIPVWEEDGFKYRPEEIKKSFSTRTRGVMVNSPANPTGTVFSAQELGAMAEIGQTIISDEIYHGLIYEGEEHSILEFTDQAFVINGFSKLFAMTGWRLGWIIAPPDYIRPMQRMQQNLFICAPSFAQSAAIAAFTECDRYVADMVQAYDERRRYVLKRLTQMGIALKFPQPEHSMPWPTLRSIPMIPIILLSKYLKKPA